MVKRLLNHLLVSSDNLKSKIQNRKLVGRFAFVFAFAMCGAVAQAQQATKIPRIGYLGRGAPSANAAPARHSSRGCASLDTWRGKALSSSGDLLRGNWMTFPHS